MLSSGEQRVTEQGGGGLADTTAYTYDADGSVFQTTVLRYAGLAATYCREDLRTVTKARYSADLKLMVATTHVDTLAVAYTVGYALYEEIEEYRYDALVTVVGSYPPS